MLVAARMDVGGLRASRDSLDRFVTDRGFDNYIETSAKANKGITELAQAMGEAVEWDQIGLIVSNQTFDRLKTAILSLRDTGATVIRFSDLNQRLKVELPDLKFTMEELSTVVGHLAAPGLVWNLDFGDFILLQPEKINSYAGAVIRTLRASDLGIIAEEDIRAGNLKFEGMQRLSPADEEIVLQAMHQTFIKRGLCAEQQTDQGAKLVFPAFFGIARPEDPDCPPPLATFELRGFLEDIYATLVVRMHHISAFACQSLWKDYAEFTVASGHHVALQLTRGREGKGTLVVHCDHNTPDDDRAIFYRYVDEHLKDNKCEDVVRTRHYVCKECGRAYLDDEEVRDALAEDGEYAVVRCTKQKCGLDIRL